MIDKRLKAVEKRLATAEKALSQAIALLSRLSELFETHLVWTHGMTRPTAKRKKPRRSWRHR